MPAVVSHYVQNKNLTALGKIYESLIVSYMDDVEKYARNSNLVQVIRHVIRAAYLEAGSRIKFQGFGRSNYGSREIGEAMRTLEKTMLLRLIYPVAHTTIPILPDKRKSPRLQVLDTGMMNHFAGLQKEIIANPELDAVYQGKVVEHIVGQELLASKFNVLNELNFWVRDKKNAEAEVDFVIGYDGKMIPIEVKSGTAGRLRSLHSFMDMVTHDVAVRLYGGVLKVDRVTTLQGKEYRLLNMPYYLAGKIEEYLGWMVTTTTPAK
jgi:predicted AAA+ superfamily ATPase